MAMFLTTHLSPGLSPEEIQSNAAAVAESKYASILNFFVNVRSGFMVTVYEAEDQNALEREYARLGFPFEDIHEIDLMIDAAGLEQMLGSGAATS